MSIKTKSVISSRFIYLGPNLTRFGLQKYAVYIGGLPLNQAQGAFDKYSLLNLLFVPVAKMAETEAAINTEGTPQYRAYQQIFERSE
ncbi:hypothetical protein LJC10_00530 [Selenomonadales bacterium OttesenSCG-928-I06]|nr:hypothetical protein [Selenomonadales bacterium OttesenSCG-928-I06]